MFKNLLVALLGFANLAACAGSGSGTSSLIPGPAAAVSARGTTPIAESLGAASRVREPHTTYAVHSVGGYFWIGGRKYPSLVNGSCRAVRLSNNQVVGCVVTAGRTEFVQKSVVGMFTGRNATGCLIAEARYRGEIVAGDVIPFVFYWVNNSCFG